MGGTGLYKRKHVYSSGRIVENISTGIWQLGLGIGREFFIVPRIAVTPCLNYEHSIWNTNELENYGTSLHYNTLKIRVSISYYITTKPKM